MQRAFVFLGIFAAAAILFTLFMRDCGSVVAP